MNTTAYLLLLLDTSTSPPTIKHAGVYSERTPTTIGPYVYVQFDKATGDDFEDASIELRARCKQYNWLKPLLDLWPGSRSR